MKTLRCAALLLLASLPASAQPASDIGYGAPLVAGLIYPQASVPVALPILTASSDYSAATPMAAPAQASKTLAIDITEGTDLLDLTLPGGAQYLSIWNPNGKEMFSQKLYGGKLQINVAGWHSGDYIIHCAQGVSTVVKRFVVKH